MENGGVKLYTEFGSIIISEENKRASYSVSDFMDLSEDDTSKIIKETYCFIMSTTGLNFDTSVDVGRTLDQTQLKNLVKYYQAGKPTHAAGSYVDAEYGSSFTFKAVFRYDEEKDKVVMSFAIEF